MTAMAEARSRGPAKYPDGKAAGHDGIFAPTISNRISRFESALDMLHAVPATSEPSCWFLKRQGGRMLLFLVRRVVLITQSPARLVQWSRAGRRSTESGSQSVSPTSQQANKLTSPARPIRRCLVKSRRLSLSSSSRLALGRCPLATKPCSALMRRRSRRAKSPLLPCARHG